MLAVATLNLGLWGLLTWMGTRLLSNVAHPVQEQYAYYVYTPAAMLLVALAGIALARFTSFRRTALTLEIVILLFFLPFILPYTGGV